MWRWTATCGCTTGKIVHMNWSHFKPEFSGRPEEGVEAHLLREIGMLH